MGFEVNNISFSYNEKEVINDISIKIKPGNFYGILGPNGSGKTTFLDILINHLHPVSGSVKLEGRNITDYSKREIAKKIALVSQNYQVNFPFRVKEIVMMGRHPYIPVFSSPGPEDIEKVKEVMIKTGIEGFKNRLITKLSGGERQRVVFARALAQDTPYLLLDEATSNLDINHSLSMLNLVSKEVALNGKTIISVFQDINMAASFCNYLILMKNGEIKKNGIVDSVLNAPSIQSVFNVESKVFFEDYSDSYHVIYKKIND